MIKRKRGIFWSLLLVVVIALGGCGTGGRGGNKENGDNKGGGQDNSQQAEAKNYVYKEEEVALEGVNASDISQIIFSEGKFIASGTKYGDTSSYSFYAVFDENGSRISYYESPEDAGETDNSFAVGSNGDIYAVMTKDIMEGSGEDAAYKMEQYLVRRSQDGTEKERISLSERASEEEYFYANRILSDGKGTLLVAGNGVLLQFDEEAGFVKLIKISEDVSEVLICRDGKVVLTAYGEQGMIVRSIDIATGQITGEYTLIQNMGYSCYAGTSYDLLLATDQDIYGYNLGDAEPKKLMDYVDSDVDAYSLYNLVSAEEENFYASYYGASDSTGHFSKFVKVAPEDVKDKITLTLGGLYIDSDIKSRIVRFNKESDTYRIRMVDYAMYNTNEDYMAGRTKLNQDIIAGNIPDIMVLDNGMPVDSYIAKGLFADLNPYMDGENGIDRSKFLNNIFEAYSVDGKLYQLVPAFSISTMIGKQELTGGKTGWNYDEFEQFIAEMPQGTRAFSNATRDEVLRQFMELGGGEFINWQTGVCSFDSEHFINFLHFLNTLPKDVDFSVYDDPESYSRLASAYRNDEAFLSMVNMAGFGEFREWREGVFGADITFVGYPSKQGVGSAIVPLQRFAIASQAVDKDAAWQFIKTFLDTDYQRATYAFPVSLERIEELAEESMQPPYYVDEQGNKVEYTESYWLGEVEVALHPMRTEDVEQVKTLLTSVTQTVRVDDSIINIIMEEAEAFFEGEKTAEEAAGIIQSRAQLYVNENR